MFGDVSCVCHFLRENIGNLKPNAEYNCLSRNTVRSTAMIKELDSDDQEWRCSRPLLPLCAAYFQGVLSGHVQLISRRTLDTDH